MTRGNVGATTLTTLYKKLEGVIVPFFYRDQARWNAMMRQAIAVNGSSFNPTGWSSSM